MRFLIQNIHFTHTVLEISEMVVNSNELTIVTGESGSGKSTLFNALTLENDFLDSIESNNKTLDKKSFINEHVSSCSQTPILLEDYNIETHIELYKKMFEVVDEEHLIEELGLKDYLKSYPRQLSGGERMRVGILLTLLRDTDMYIFDEPTSSLDTELSKKVIQLIEEKKEEGKYILVFTHDPLFIEKADHHYSIEDKKLIELKRLDKSFNKELSDNRKEKEDISNLLSSKKRMNLFQKLFSILLSFIIGLTSFSFVVNNFVEQAEKKHLNELESSQMMVSISNIENNDYRVIRSEGKVLTKKQVEEIKNIDHVTRVDWRYDFRYPVVGQNDVTKTSNLYDEQPATLHLKNGESIVYKNFNFDGHTYQKDNKYKKDIKEDYGIEGLYLSQSFLIEHKDFQTDLNGASLTIQMPIPAYNCFGRQLAGIGDNDDLYYVNCDVVELVEMTIPIAGILNGDSFGVGGYFAEPIYIERGYIEKYLDKYKGKESRVIYAMDPEWTKYYINDCPKDEIENVNRKMEESPWEPTNYTVTVDSLDNLSYIGKILKSKGYTVESLFFNDDSYVDILTIDKTAFIIGSCISVVIVLIAQILLKYIRHKDEEINFIHFFKSKGMDDDSIKEMNRKIRVTNTLKRVLFSFIFYILIIQIMNRITIGRTDPAILSIIIMIVLSLLIELIIPSIFMTRLMNSDVMHQ